MALHNNVPLSHSAAKRQLNALVRKYNQASSSFMGNELHIKIDSDQLPESIIYTLIMKHPSNKSWEIRRVTTDLHMSLQHDFTQMVCYMQDRLKSYSNQ